MNIDYKTAGVSVVVAVALMFAFGFGSDGLDGRDGSVGASPGPEHTETQYFLSNFSKVGNIVATTSDASTYKLTAREVDIDTSYVAWNASLNTTLTFPNATSAPFTRMRTGQSFDQWWYSATTTEATTITFAAPAGNGIDLQEPELDGTVILNGLEFAKITYLKTGDSAVSIVTDITQLGD